MRGKLLLANVLLALCILLLAGGDAIRPFVLAMALSLAGLSALVQSWLITRSAMPLERHLRKLTGLPVRDRVWEDPLPPLFNGELDMALAAMVTSARKQIVDINSDMNRLEGILASISEAVLVTGLDGRVVLANDALARLFDMEQPLAGRLAAEVMRHSAVQDVMAKCLVDGRSAEVEVSLAGGPERFLDVQVAPIRDGDTCVGTVTVLYDITRLRQLERMRRDFVANVSHELRTPLTAIKGYAETLADGALADKDSAARFIGVISNHANRLSRLLDDLLDLSHLESDQMQVELASCRLRSIVETSVGSVKTAALQKRIVLNCDIAPDLEVLCDAKLCEQAMINLLDNAIKYTPEEGEVCIGTQEATKKGRITIFVRDTGIGIPSEDLRRIFERFYRVDKGRSRAMGGTGLGLAIVRHIVEAHGEQIRVESNLGEGTTFSFDLCIAD